MRVDKSPVLAVILTVILGPLGLLYVAVVPALVLLVVAATGYFTFGVTAGLAWIVSIAWAFVEASRRHQAFERWRQSTGNQGIPLPGYHQGVAQSFLPGEGPPLPPPGWYPDSADASKIRWWDGSQWAGEAQTPVPPAAQPPSPGPPQWPGAPGPI